MRVNRGRQRERERGRERERERERAREREREKERDTSSESATTWLNRNQADVSKGATNPFDYVPYALISYARDSSMKATRKWKKKGEKRADLSLSLSLSLSLLSVASSLSGRLSPPPPPPPPGGFSPSLSFTLSSSMIGKTMASLPVDFRLFQFRSSTPGVWQKGTSFRTRIATCFLLYRNARLLRFTFLLSPIYLATYLPIYPPPRTPSPRFAPRMEEIPSARGA